MPPPWRPMTTWGWPSNRLYGTNRPLDDACGAVSSHLSHDHYGVQDSSSVFKNRSKRQIVTILCDSRSSL